MSDDLRDMLAAFAAAGVRYLVVGAHALAAHGVPRVTGDLDVWIDPARDNAAAVWRALAAFGAPAAQLGMTEPDFATPGIVAQFGLSNAEGTAAVTAQQCIAPRSACRLWLPDESRWSSLMR